MFMAMRWIFFISVAVFPLWIACGGAHAQEAGDMKDPGSISAFTAMPAQQQEEMVREFARHAPEATAFGVTPRNVDVNALRSCGEAYARTPGYSERMGSMYNIFVACLAAYHMPKP
jgi:hypothetical protein